MAAYLRLNRFVESANHAYHTEATDKALVADGDAVSLQDSATTDQNKRTWKVFRESLFGTIGQEKFEWICHRYRSRLNFTRMEQSGSPLLSKHVELFSTGSSQLLGRDIKARFPGKLSELTRTQLREKIRLVQPFPIVGSYRDPLDIAGSPTSLWAYFFHDKVLMDKEKQLIISDVQRLTFPAWLERMAKVGANREFLERQLIPAPGQDGNLDYYKVHRKIATGDGLVAYALKGATRDSTLKPLILFRPSQWAFSNEDAFETYYNDVQGNIGELGYDAAKHAFAQLMEDPSFRRLSESASIPDERVSVAGYSLGGAHAQRFLEDHFKQISNAVFYSDPHIDNETAERIRKEMNSMPRRSEPLNIQIFRVKGDIVHYAGDKHAGCGVEHPDINIQLSEVDHENKTTAVTRLHSHRLFDNSAFPYQMKCYENTAELFDLLDNSKRGPEVLWYETNRRFWGWIAHYSLFGVQELIKLVSWTLGVKILRSSRDPEF